MQSFPRDQKIKIRSSCQPNEKLHVVGSTDEGQGRSTLLNWCALDKDGSDAHNFNAGIILYIRRIDRERVSITDSAHTPSYFPRVGPPARRLTASLVGKRKRKVAVGAHTRSHFSDSSEGALPRALQLRRRLAEITTKSLLWHRGCTCFARPFFAQGNPRDVIALGRTWAVI